MSAPPLFSLQADANVVRVAAVEGAMGRVRCTGRDLVQDVEGWPGFAPLPVARQATRPPLELAESRASEALVETLASAVAQLAFGLRGSGLQLAVAMGDKLSADGQDVEVLASGPRVPALGARLTGALAGRGIRVVDRIHGPVELDAARVAGERWCPTGALPGIDDALLVVWGDVARILRVRGGRFAGAFECEAAGLVAMERAYHTAGGERRLGASARRGEALAQRTLAAAAAALGARLTADLVDHRAPCDALVLTGPVAALAADPRLAALFQGPLERALEAVGTGEEDGAQGAGLRVSFLDEAPLLGAAAGALGLER